MTDTIPTDIADAIALGDRSAHVSIRHLARQTEVAFANRRATANEALAVLQDAKIEPADKASTLEARASKHIIALHELRQKIEVAKADAESGRPALPPAQSAGEAQIDAEIRALVRDMPADKKAQLPEHLQRAVARGPAELSGVTPAMHTRYRDAVLHREFPDAMAAFEADRLAIKGAERTVIVAAALHKSALNSRSWHQYLKDIEATSLADL